MNKTTFLLPAALCLVLSLPVQGHKSTLPVTDEPDSVTVCNADTVEASYSEDDDWAGLDEDFSFDPSATDSADADPDHFCAYDDELMTSYETKNVDYKLQPNKNSENGLTFSALLFTPNGVANHSVANSKGYDTMVSHILSAMLNDEDAAKWKDDTLDKMIESKWSMLKKSYISDQAELKKSMGKDYQPLNYSYRTTLTPVWQFKNQKCTTYSIEDEAYTGGAHGMPYHYFLTLNDETQMLMGLTDIFKTESLPDVFKLVGEKLKTGPQAANDEQTWPSVAEVIPAPSANDYSVRSSQMLMYEGKWYPRPALTECGIVFTYPPYIKNCYAAGTINILITYDEAKEWLKNR